MNRPAERAPGNGTAEPMGSATNPAVEHAQEPASFVFDEGAEKEIGAVLAKYPPTRIASGVIPLL